MIRGLILMMFLCSTQIGLAKKIHGKVINDLDETMYGVLVFVNDVHQGYTNCSGKFTVTAEEGDTLAFFKPFYWRKKVVVKAKRKYTTLLLYDYESTKQKLDQHYPEGMGGGSQPLFVVDGQPFVFQSLDIDPERIKSVTVLKGKIATEMFGKAASNGVLLITLGCLSEE